jgi:diguanylate cyclase (GGDEF)-like protein/PAS domain S-box-containing protein
VRFHLETFPLFARNAGSALQPILIWLSAGSNLTTAAAFFCISLALVVSVLRLRSTQHRRVLSLFTAFIVSGGVSHLLMGTAFWAPLPWLGCAVDVMTAVLSILTAIVTWPAIEKTISAERELQAARSITETSQRRLEELAMQDGLTGLANRRHFDVFLDAEIRRARRTGTSLALIMMDVDKFKPFNDMYGHPSGDACLRLISAAILGQLRRAGDLAARFGGDEFAAILPGADQAGATVIAERIVQAIRNIGILHPANTSGIVTASLGVAAIVPNPTTRDPTDFVQLADTALYAAKDKGGNQVCTGARPAQTQGPIFGSTDDGGRLLAAEPDANWVPRMPAGIDFVSILRGIPFGVLVTDSTQPDHPIIFANSGFTKMTGYSLKETVGRNSRFLQGAETDQAIVTEISEALRHGVPIQRELLNYRKDGQTFWNELFMQPLLDRHGAVVGFVGLQIDQTPRRRAEASQQDSEARLATIIENLPGYIFQRIVTASGTLLHSYFSQTYWRLLGLDEASHFSGYDPIEHVHLADIGKVRNAVAHSLAAMAPCTVEFRAVRANGDLLWLRTQSTPRLLSDGKVVWDGVGVDITTEMASKESLAYLAYHDPLTGLCNRILFIKTLEEMCATHTNTPQTIAILSIDLDSFQQYNDLFGTSVGDALLRCVAERLGGFAGLSGVSARLGGDEFGVAIAGIPTGITVADKVADLSRVLQEPMRVGEHDISIMVCVGATQYPFADSDHPTALGAAEELIKQSNFALADAKRAGKGGFRLYSKQLDDRDRNRTILRESMRRGLQERQFVLHYHPIVELATGEIVGAEALVRWAHPILGMQRPDLFVPEAEVSGLIVPLGAWVLRSALKEMRSWQGISARSLRVAINVSAVQLSDRSFLGMIEEALKKTGAEPALVDIELTESVLIDASALNVLNALRELGFQLAVDDFGTGYSSFRYLQTLPVSTVKIDQTFVRHMVIDSSDASIVRAIAAVAKSLRLDVVAEGIETPLQRDFLRDEGCCVGQGYLFSLPLAAEDFRWLLQSKATLPLGEDYTPAFRTEPASPSGTPRSSDDKLQSEGTV